MLRLTLKHLLSYVWHHLVPRWAQTTTRLISHMYRLLARPKAVEALKKNDCRDSSQVLCSCAESGAVQLLDQALGLAPLDVFNHV